ncbi:LysR substrate-binding domain-containing protein [Paenibacillus sp. strain BS8-2]
MEFRQLDYFLAVSDELHFTKAADKLGVSQPTLSLQIRSLEDELGVMLFDRIGKRIALTEAGTMLREYGHNIMRSVQYAKDSIRELRTFQRGSATIAVLPSDLDYRISKLLIDYHTEYPQIKLSVTPSIEIPQLVLENQADLGIGLMPQRDDRLITIPICTEEYALVVSEHHRLAALTSIHVNELAEIDMVMYPEGAIGRTLVDDTFQEHGFRIRTLMETGSVTSLLQLVKANLGATVQPIPLIDSIHDPAFRCIRIVGGAPVRHLCIIHRADHYLGHAARAFMAKTISHFSD